MNRKSIYALLLLLIILAMAISSCGTNSKTRSTGSAAKPETVIITGATNQLPVGLNPPLTPETIRSRIWCKNSTGKWYLKKVVNPFDQTDADNIMKGFPGCKMITGAKEIPPK